MRKLEFTLKVSLLEAIFLGELMRIISPVEVTLSDKSVVDRTAPSGLEFEFAEGAKRLATPWQTAVMRARILRHCNLPEGVILDPACGSAIQLAAYSAILGRPALGIELDEETAVCAARNIKRVFDFRSEDSPDSRIVVADSRNSNPIVESLSELLGDNEGICLLQLDPARPQNSREHGLDEMKPKLDEVFDAWSRHLNLTDKGPAILLDLSPRLRHHQRLEVENLINSVFKCSKTWTFTSRGGGRVDRLSVWIGAVSSVAHRRYIRLPSDVNAEPIIIEGGGPLDEMESVPELKLAPPRRGGYISIIDSALVESGLAIDWLESVLGCGFNWLNTSGRRPSIFHLDAIELEESRDRDIIQAHGKIVLILTTDELSKQLDEIIEQGADYGISRVVIRCEVDPNEQPKLQGELDRRLASRGKGLTGFIYRHPLDNRILICEDIML